MRVQWQTPSDDGGVGISNYTLTLTSQEETLLHKGIDIEYQNLFSLLYNREYLILLSSNNCMGESDVATASISYGIG